MRRPTSTSMGSGLLFAMGICPVAATRCAWSHLPGRKVPGRDCLVEHAPARGAPRRTESTGVRRVKDLHLLTLLLLCLQQGTQVTGECHDDRLRAFGIRFD